MYYNTLLSILQNEAIMQRSSSQEFNIDVIYAEAKAALALTRSRTENVLNEYKEAGLPSANMDKMKKGIFDQLDAIEAYIEKTTKAIKESKPNDAKTALLHLSESVNIQIAQANTIKSKIDQEVVRLQDLLQIPKTVVANYKIGIQ